MPSNTHSKEAIMAKKRFSIGYDDVVDGTIGICISCGDIVHGIEPDARGYRCENCGRDTVYGAEEAVLMGAVDLND